MAPGFSDDVSVINIITTGHEAKSDSRFFFFLKTAHRAIVVLCSGSTALKLSIEL